MCCGVVCIMCYVWYCFFFFQAEDGIRDLVRSRGLGDVYKRQVYPAWDVSDKNTPKDFWNSQYSVEAYHNRIKKYLDFCVNIDYRTLTREQVADVMKAVSYTHLTLPTIYYV